jgi:glycosyltransferase involved in cell wall biosynthesis
MIVKNETHIIKECLESMVSFIDRYDITDTGSTDGTPELIKEFMDEHGIPGEVYISDWKGFGKSRTEALKRCDGKADYMWMIDADDRITGTFNYPRVMDAYAYSLRLGRPDFSWFRNQIFKTGVDWEYTGILHEYAECKSAGPEARVIKWDEGDYFVEARTLGARNVGIDPKEKYARDAEQLLDALTNEDSEFYEPNNVRYQFYLAQSFFDSHQWDKAEEAYKKRIEMGGWDEEIWFSYFRIAILKAIQEQTWEEVKQAYLEAFEYRPHRAEPLYEIARVCRSMGRPRQAYIYARMGSEIQYPNQDILFIAKDVYDWKMIDEFGSVAFYIGDYMNGLGACQRLLSENKFPESERERIVNNLKSYENQMTGIHQQQIQQQQQQQEFLEEQKRLEKESKKEEKIIKAMQPKKSTKTQSPKKVKKKRK